MTLPGASLPTDAIGAEIGAAISAAIGIDIGGTNTKLARVSSTGQVRRVLTIPTTAHGDPAPYLKKLQQGVEELLQEGPTQGIGLALNGFLADDLRSSRYSPNSPALEGIDFASWLENFGMPCQIEQDLNAPALAEYYFGEYRYASRLLTAAIGTGLGAGMVVDGQVLRLAGGTLGDTGHIILEPGGPTCTAGCHGCAEALVSAPGIERLALQQAGSSFTAREVIAAALRDEGWATAILETVGNWLGQWLASLAPIFLPSHILLCGGVAEAGEILLRTARQRFYALSGPEYTRSQIDFSRFGGQAGVIGAAAPLLVSKR